MKGTIAWKDGMEEKEMYSTKTTGRVKTLEKDPNLKAGGDVQEAER